jgi:hypothetical protein
MKLFLTWKQTAPRQRTVSISKCVNCLCIQTVRSPNTFYAFLEHKLHDVDVTSSPGYYLDKGKGKAVPQHMYRGAGGIGCIAPTHSRSRHKMGVNSQHHAPAVLYPPSKDPRYPLYKGLSEPQSRSGHRGQRRKSFRFCRGSNLDCPIVQSVARQYTDWPTPAPH